jgi:hypothetical protein
MSDDMDEDREARLLDIIQNQRSMIKSQALIIKEIMATLPVEWKENANVRRAIAISDKIVTRLADVEPIANDAVIDWDALKDAVKP